MLDPGSRLKYTLTAAKLILFAKRVVFNNADEIPETMAFTEYGYTGRTAQLEGKEVPQYTPVPKEIFQLNRNLEWVWKPGTDK